MTIKIAGISDVRRALGQVMPREGKLLTRQTTKDVAQAIADEAKALMPVDTGAMKAGTVALQEKDKDGVGRASVRVRDAYYWRFLEYGDGPDGIEHAFFARGREKVMQDIDQIATEAFKRRLAARIAKVAGR